MAGGSITTGSAGSAIQKASLVLRARLLEGATGDHGPFLGVDATALRFSDGHLVGPGGKSVPIAEVLSGLGWGDTAEEAIWKPSSMEDKKMRYGLEGGMAFSGPVTEDCTSFSFGAQFAEVHIDPMLRTVRVARMVGVFACGRIINPRTARSNLVGGMIWGASHALLEESVIDRPQAMFANKDLAGYHFSSCADIGEVVCEMIDEEDKLVNAIGAKAVGEIGIVGMPAAIANAVYNATGIRVRKTPILAEDLLP